MYNFFNVNSFVSWLRFREIQMCVQIVLKLRTFTSKQICLLDFRSLRMLKNKSDSRLCLFELIRIICCKNVLYFYLLQFNRSSVIYNSSFANKIFYLFFTMVFEKIWSFWHPNINFFNWSFDSQWLWIRVYFSEFSEKILLEVLYFEQALNTKVTFSICWRCLNRTQNIYCNSAKKTLYQKRFLTWGLYKSYVISENKKQKSV